MKKKLHLLATALTCISVSFSQTSPTPWNLSSSGNFSLTNLNPSASSLPAGVAIHQMNASPVALATTPASDIPLPCTQVQSNNTNVWGLSNQGIGIRSNPTAASTGYSNGKQGQVMVAVNTTNRTQVKLSFKAGTFAVGSGQSAIFRLRCQYRVGSSGTWLELPGGVVEYQPINSIDSVSKGPYTLPAAAENQPVVQVRWVYYYVSGSWSSSNNRTQRVRLDDITISSVPLVTQSPFPITCPNSPSFVLTGGSPAGGTYSGTGVSGGNTFNPAAAGVGTFPITYSYTDAQGNTNSATQNITVDNNACTTQLISSQCGGSNFQVTDYLYCDPLAGAEDYDWMISNSSLGFSAEHIKGNNYQSVRLYDFPGMQYGQTYTVQVRGKIQGQWRNWGPACSISMMSSIPFTQLEVGSCGATNVSLNDVLYCKAIGGATNYQYEFTTSSGFTSVYTKNNSTWTIGLWAVVGLQYGQTYNVRVKSYVSNQWSDYGPSCTITMQSGIPGTKLDVGYCGATNLTTTSVVYSTPVAAAQDYQYYIWNSSAGYSVFMNKGNNFYSFSLSVVPNLQMGQTYTVQVRAMVNGTWGSFGDPCTITLGGGASRVMAVNEDESELGSDATVSSAKMYPNPLASGASPRVKITGAAGGQVTLNITDYTGRVLYSRTLNTPGNTYETELNEFPRLSAGIYFVRISTGKGDKIDRFIVE